MLRKLLGLLAALSFIVPVVWADDWSGSFEDPDSGTYGEFDGSTVSASQIDDYSRNMRHMTRWRAEVEHFWGTLVAPGDDNGLHRLGSARCYMSNTEPDQLDDTHSLAVTLTDLDSTGSTGQNGLTELDDAASNSAGAAEDDIGHGRCWIDLDGPDNTADTADDNQLWIFVGETTDTAGAWQQITSEMATGIKSRSAGNLVFNGSFELTDGTGETTAITDTPFGWADVNGPADYTYSTATASEGAGYQLNITGANTVSSGIDQELFQLKANTTYVVVVRMRPQVAGDICVIATTNAGGTNMTPATVTGPQSDFTTITGEFTTHATLLDDVNLLIYASAIGDICEVDHVGVYEKNPQPVPQPGLVVFEAESSSSTGCSSNDWTTCAGTVAGIDLWVKVTPPGPGYIAEVQGAVGFATGSDARCAIRIYDGSNSIATMSWSDSTSGARSHGVYRISKYIPTPLEAGVTTTYQLDTRRTGSGTCTLDVTASGSNPDGQNHYIQVILHPPR
jgi:hypothetical protein